MTLKESTSQHGSANKDEAARLASALMDVNLSAPDMKQQQHNALFDPSNRIDDDEFPATRTLKEMLIHATLDDIQALQQLITTRLDEGRGETLFEIGVEDDGEKMMLTEDEYKKSLATIEQIVSALDADYAIVEERGKDSATRQQGVLANLMIRKRLKTVEDLLEIRIAVVGNVVCWQLTRKPSFIFSQ
ncbi:hypothetical protein BJV82DRAFT_609552 [Fennellomyces sp. T-0311]|nr:hypothetical protein BJV82DRAFT_609552 [Fennellomyces sp. T-0311]